MAVTHKLCCTAFGVDFDIAADSADLLAAMQERTPWGTKILARASEGAVKEFTLRRRGPGHSLTVTSDAMGESMDGDKALEAYAHEVMLHVAEHSPEHIFLHAGVVAWQARGLLLPGMSFAGKTTLVAELVRAGATYYSDEYALVDTRGLVHPYPRPLALRLPGSEKQTPAHVEDLGGVAGTEPLRVSHVVFTEHTADAAWSPEPVSAGMAVLEMLRHAVPVRRAPQRAMEALARMMDGAKALQSPRCEASETARVLLAMLQNEAAA